jgi:RNA polymerase sigma-70 factor (ECF subfamily)
VSPQVFASPLALAAVREGDDEERSAFTFLYEHHAPRIHRFLRDLLGDGALAWDATQETFARAFRLHREILADRARAVPWLFGIARNVSLEMRKARARCDRVMTARDVEHAVDASPESELLGREAARVIARALAKLSEDRRAMLLLRLDHDLSYEDIATLMGFSLAKVKVEIHRAREVLRETLEEYRRGAR